MATVVSTPVLTWIAGLGAAASGVNQSSKVYFTLNNTGGWELQVPVYVRYSGVSNDDVVSVYASSDNATRYDTQPMAAFSVTRLTGDWRVASLRVPVGQYLIEVLHSGPHSGLVAVLTQQTLTAIINV